MAPTHQVAPRKASLQIKIFALIAILFGAATVFSGWQVLFGSSEIRQAAGDVVPFVLKFNFLAGFAYILAGIGLLARKVWATWISAVILLCTIGVFAIFGILVAQGTPFEARTVAALSLRSTVWLVITIVAATQIGWTARSSTSA